MKQKLHTHEERIVALEYLCGVPPEQIKKKWDISEETITQGILKKRSLSWEDSLVEFYKQNRKERNSHKNSIHLFLIYNEIDEIPNKQLINKERDLDVYRSLRKHVFEPKNKELIRDLNLDEILHSGYMTKKTGEEKLVDAVFGSILFDTYDIIDELIHPLLFENLKKQYDEKNKTISECLDSTYDEIKTIIQQSFYKGLALSLNERFNGEYDKNIKREIKNIYGTIKESSELSKTEKKEILKMYFGIGKDYPIKQKEIATKFKSSKVYIRQIKDNILKIARIELS